MFKLIKFLLKTILTLAILLVIIAIAIPMIIDPNDYKKQIEEQVKLKTGSDLKIVGDINIALGLSPSYLPTSLSFDLGETELSQPKGFSTLTKNSFLKVNKVAIKAAILPLIQENRLEVGKIILDQANIFLVKDKQGIANWDVIAKSQSSENPNAEKKQKKSATSSDKSKREMPSIQIEGVEINNSIVSYDDYSSGKHLSLNKLSLNISELKENKPVNIKFKTDFNSLDQNLTGNFSINTEASVNLKQQLYQLQKTKLQLNILGSSLPNGKNQTTLSGDIKLDLLKQVLTIKNMQLNSYQLDLTGDLAVNDLMTKPQFKSQINLAPFSPKVVAKNLGITLPKMKNEKVLNKFGVNLEITGNENQLNLTNLDAMLDDIVIKGKAAILNLQNPSYQVKLDINKVYLDDYAIVQEPLANKEPSANNKSSAKSEKLPVGNVKAKTEQALIPVDLIKKLNVNGQLKIGEFMSNNVKMTNILLQLKSSKGVLQLDPVQSDFYKGKLKLKTTIDVRNKSPKISLTQDFKQIDLGQLLLDATGTQEFTGTANISSQITTHGNFQKQLIKNSNGKGHFLITDGHIAKLDIIQKLRAAHAVFYGKAAPTDTQQANSSFTELKGSVIIKKGVVSNQDLYSKSPVMKLSGSGTADLPNEYLDYTLKVVLLNSLNIDKQTDTTDFRDKEIPYTIKGKFSQLSQQANLKNILKQQAKAEVKKQADKQVDKYLESDKGKKLEEKLGKDNVKMLKGLFKF